MFQIDTLLALAVGLWYTHAVRDALSSEVKWTRSRFLGVANAAIGLFLVPWAMYFFAVWPSWECFYWFSFTDRLTGSPLAAAIVPLFAMSVVLALNLGFGLGHTLVRRGHDRMLAILRWLALLGVLGILAGNLEPLSWVGTTAQYRSPGHAGTVRLLASAFFTYFVGSSAVFMAGLIAGGVYLKRVGRVMHLAATPAAAAP